MFIYVYMFVLYICLCVFFIIEPSKFNLVQNICILGSTGINYISLEIIWYKYQFSFFILD